MFSGFKPHYNPPSGNIYKTFVWAAYCTRVANVNILCDSVLIPMYTQLFLFGMEMYFSCTEGIPLYIVTFTVCPICI